MRAWKQTTLGAMVASTLTFYAATVSAQAIPPGPPPAFFDAKTMPGNACAVTSSTNSAAAERQIPSLWNVSERNVQVTCPIVRDNTTNGNGTFSAQLVGSNATAGTRFYCALYSMRDDGRFVMATGSSFTRAGNFTLNLDVNGSPFNGVYTIYCNVPSKSRLHSYRWAEPMITDRNN